jgi:V-type ATP synthase subunit E
LIPEVVKGWIKTNEADVSVILSPEDAQKLESSLLAAFKKEVEKGIEVKSDAQLAGGFRIGVKDGAAYYDFSAESVADLFSAYISSRAARLLKDAVKEL